MGSKERGGEADADRVRNGDPKYLAKALEKACGVLTKRVAGLSSVDPLHLWIEGTLETAEARSEALKTEKLQDVTEAMKAGKLLNNGFPLWEAYADSLHLIHMYLKSKSL